MPVIVVTQPFKCNFEYIHKIIDNVMYRSLEEDIKMIIYNVFKNCEGQDLNHLATIIKKLLFEYIDKNTEEYKYYTNIHRDISKYIKDKVEELLDHIVTNLNKDKNYKLENILL